MFEVIVVIYNVKSYDTIDNPMRETMRMKIVLIKFMIVRIRNLPIYLVEVRTLDRKFFCF